jgi:hypothetical protein
MSIHRRRRDPHSRMYRFFARPEFRYEVAAFALLLAYVNAFSLWQILARSLGRVGAELLPLILLAAAAGAIGGRIVMLRRRGIAVRLWFCLGAGALAALAACLVDPLFPAKRIHVAEYMVLAWVVDRMFRRELTGVGLLAATALMTAALGSHDELIQGLYPGRTYGLRDVVVNAVSGLAGALLIHGFAPAREPGGPPARWKLSRSEWLAVGALIAGWGALLLALSALRGGPVPLWPLLPLFAGAVACAIAIDRPQGVTGGRSVLRKIAFIMVATAVYPLLSHALALDLH